MRDNIHNKKRFSRGTATLILGILSIIYPVFYSIVTVLLFYYVISKNILLHFVIYAGYGFLVSYFVIIILGVVSGILDLFRKPRPWHKEDMKTLLGLAFIFFSLIVIGRIFIFSELFRFIVSGGAIPGGTR